MLTETDIQQVVHSFYARIRADDMLGPVFATKIGEDDWDRHEAHIADFWSSIFLKTGRFKGNPMLKHAVIPDITPAHFKHWLCLFAQTTEQVLGSGQAKEMQLMAERIAQSLQMGLAFNHEKDGRTDHPFKEFGLRRSHLDLEP